MVESWIAPLEAGDPEASWDLFIERYRCLIFGAIRHYTTEPDEVMDVFARVCEALRENDFARFRRCAVQVDPARPLSTWLVVVVHNQTIDWFRHRNGRPRLSALAVSLPPLRRRIFEYVFLEQRSHVEAYELLRSRENPRLAFGEFLEELRATYRAATAGRTGRLVAELAIAPGSSAASPDPSGDDPAVRAEQRAVLGAALASLPAGDRLAVQLYVVDGDLTFSALAGSGGFGHSCALTGAGAAYCWGRNIAGELGNGSRDFDASSTPLAVSGGLSFSAVVTGAFHTCGLTTAGAAYCWGDDHWGELGDSSATCETCESSMPVPVYGDLSFRTLASNGGHTCGLANNGPAYCWGLNDFGQLGDGSTTNRSAPVLVAGTKAMTHMASAHEVPHISTK
jgi:RNA polymerase sigma factor (sigma-70 family)